ncbi:MAG: methionine adenosyltransferase domain-containing protein, partial [Candidatus Limnocylindrus sp.]
MLGLATSCEIALSYAIGVEQPIAIHVQTEQVPWATFEEGELESKEAAIAYAVGAVFDFSPQGIIEGFGLRAPIYLQTARDGHVGNPELPWEEESTLIDL